MQPNIELPTALSALRLLEVEFAAGEKIKLANEVVEFLTLSCCSEPTVVDVSESPSLTYLSIGGKLPTVEVRVPKTLSKISIGAAGLMINYDRTIESEPFDTKILAASENIIEVDTILEISEKSTQPLPFVKHLTCNSIRLVPKLFVNLERLATSQIDATQIRELIKQLPSLRELEVGSVLASEEEITSIHSEFPAISLRASVNSGQPFIERYFSNGQWVEESVR
jgi:hypothetical protein